MNRVSKKFVSKSSLTREEISTDYAVVGKVSSESVEKHTGKNWKTWIGILTRAGAESWGYSEIVAYLRKKHRLSPWWQQGVALGFEIATGRRKTGQDAKGKYMVTATKSLRYGVVDVWRAIVSESGQEIWLQPFMPIELAPKVQFETRDGFFGEVRTLVKARRIRLFWQDPLWEKHTVVELMLVPKPGKKSILAINHMGLQNESIKSKMRERWRKSADALAKLLG